MKNRKFLDALSDFVLGKGFYIVLFLCATTIGVSGYYLVRGMVNLSGELTPGDTSAVVQREPVVLPDPVELEPVGGGEDEPTQSAALPKPVEIPDKQEETPKEDKPKEQTPQKPKAMVYTWPVKGAVLRDFSVEVLSPDPTMGDWRTHGGLDISAPLEGKVLAMCDGTVAEVRQDGLMGMTVVIDHGEGLTSTYCNLAAEVEVGEGDTVKTGTVIGAVGDTAIAEVGLVSHLHLEVCLNGDAVDPLDYLPELL